VLGQTRDPDTLRADVLKMREEMALHKKPGGPLDAKLLRGGLVDLEFIIHFLQLRERTGFSPDLGNAIDALADAGLMPPEIRKAHDLMTRLLIAGRLLCPDQAEPPPAAAEALAQACQCETYTDLLRRLSEARGAVAALWLKTFDQKLELEQ
jgi:glutamate-ammonia-ligase adenylyltransferase